MSPSAIATFAQLAARTRAQSLGGRVEDATCASDGNNLSIPDATAPGGIRRFRAPFTRLTTAVELRTHGRSLRCTAVIMLRAQLGLTLDETTIVTHLPSGETYDVAQIGIEHPNSSEHRILLRRIDP